MDVPEIQDLFRRFAAPLGSYAATSEERRELAEMLVQHLWMAMIAGPSLEEEIWQGLISTGHLAPESLQAVQEVYFQQMKPAVSEEELAMLRKRFVANNRGCQASGARSPPGKTIRTGL